NGAGFYIDLPCISGPAIGLLTIWECGLPPTFSGGFRKGSALFNRPACSEPVSFLQRVRRLLIFGTDTMRRIGDFGSFTLPGFSCKLRSLLSLFRAIKGTISWSFRCFLSWCFAVFYDYQARGTSRRSAFRHCSF